jgi:L-fuconolactonase
MYRFDPSYVLEVVAKHPDRFCLVKPVDPYDLAIADNIADWKAKKGTAGLRILMREDVSADPTDPGLNRVLAAAAKHSLPVNLFCTGRLEQAGQLAARNPNTRLVIDHLGLQQPLAPPAPAQPWADLPKVLSLATYPMLRSRSLAPAHWRTIRSRIKTSGTRSAAFSMPLASTVVFGAPTGHVRLNC